ncbi:MAG TPA: R3H domain-containing nucleic acid-binding protein [Acidobacteriaceae bacterium]|nr:R3H domain-containing nucleic acid-binding protein [Acidobacteriaceae bacterium]
MDDLAQAAEKVAALMRILTSTAGLRLKYRITAGAGAADPDGFERRDIYVECKGPDAGLLLDRDGELLRALEHVAAKALRLEPEDHDRISFDAEGFKAARVRHLRRMAESAIDRVDDTNRPYSFPPMSSRERRMLHVFLRDSGLQTASSGEGSRRYVVVYPEGYRVPSEEERAGASFERGAHGRGRGRGDRHDDRRDDRRGGYGRR